MHERIRVLKYLLTEILYRKHAFNHLPNKPHLQHPIPSLFPLPASQQPLPQVFGLVIISQTTSVTSKLKMRWALVSHILNLFFFLSQWRNWLAGDGEGERVREGGGGLGSEQSPQY